MEAANRPDIRTTLRSELNRAQDARLSGNEGMARVCARRAAGWAIQHYLSSFGKDPGLDNAYKYIDFLYKKESNLEIQAALENMLTRVDEDMNLPPEVDLLEDAYTVIKTLLGEDLRSTYREKPATF